MLGKTSIFLQFEMAGAMKWSKLPGFSRENIQMNVNGGIKCITDKQTGKNNVV